MKQLIAIVKPYLAEKVVEALRRAPLEALTVREVQGYGRQKSYLEEYGQSEYALAFLPKVEIEAWVEDSRAAEVIERISQFAHTGRMGDGKIFVLPVGSFESISEPADAPPARPYYPEASARERLGSGSSLLSLLGEWRPTLPRSPRSRY